MVFFIVTVMQLNSPTLDPLQSQMVFLCRTYNTSHCCSSYGSERLKCKTDQDFDSTVKKESNRLAHTLRCFSSNALIPENTKVSVGREEE